MVAKKTAKRKPIKRAKTIQKAKGKGQNININIDQSKRTTRKTTSQPARPQQVMTFMPSMSPQPSYIPFPFPTPNLNPFESVVRESQKGKIQEEPNELEKPKPKEKEIKADDIYDIPEATFIGSFPFQEELPKIKAERIKKKEQPRMAISPESLFINENVNLMESSWFNPSRETTTPIEEQNKKETKKPQLLTIYNPKIREGGSNIVTLSDLSRERRDIEQLGQNLNREYWTDLNRGLPLGGPVERLSREQLREQRLSIFEPKVEKVINKPKKEKTIISEEPKKEIQQTKPIILMETSEEERRKKWREEQEEKDKKWKEQQTKLEVKYPSFFGMSDEQREQYDIDTFLSDNPGTTYKDYKEYKQLLKKQEQQQQKEIDDATKKRAAEESQEGFKSEDILKKELMIDEYRTKIKKLSLNKLRSEAKERGLKYSRDTSKDKLYNLLMDDMKSKI